MANFYDSWLGFWDKGNEAKAEARTSIHEEDLEWIETDQDSRVALLAAPENGFATWGSEYMIGKSTPAGTVESTSTAKRRSTSWKARGSA